MDKDYITDVVTAAIGIENIDSKHSTQVIFGNQKSNINCTSNPCAVEPIHYQSLIPGKHISPILSDFLFYLLLLW